MRVFVFLGLCIVCLKIFGAAHIRLYQPFYFGTAMATSQLALWRAPKQPRHRPPAHLVMGHIKGKYKGKGFLGHVCAVYGKGQCKGEGTDEGNGMTAHLMIGMIGDWQPSMQQLVELLDKLQRYIDFRMATQSEHFGGLGYGKGKSAGKGKDSMLEDLMTCIVEEGGMPMEELIDLLDKVQRYEQQRMAPDV